MTESYVTAIPRQAMNLTDRENKQDKTKSEERLQISAEIGKVPDNNDNR